MERTAEWTQAEADRWIAENPYAWGEIEKAAVRSARNGHRFSIRQLCDHVRFEMATNGFSDGFKMNNSLHPVFARKLIAKHPELEGYIETRKSKVDGLVAR